MIRKTAKMAAKKAAKRVAAGGAKLACKAGSKIGEIAVKGVMGRKVQRHRAGKVLSKVRDKV
jgi:hypothetical protein